MPLVRVYLFVVVSCMLAGWFLAGPLIATGITLLACLIVLIWYIVSTDMVLTDLQARHMTDAFVTDQKIYRLFLGDARQIKAMSGLPGVRFYLIDTHVPIAFSLGARQGPSQIILTSGLFKTLTRSEIAAVVGHEMGHLRAGDSMLNAMRLSLSMMVSRSGFRPAIRTIQRMMPKSALLNRLLIRPECRADAFSATLCKDATILASALKKLERGVRAVHWSALDKLPFLAAVTIVDPFSAQKTYDRPEHSKTAHRVAELYRLELPEAA